MTDKLISFETAKLAKEKGFDLKNDYSIEDFKEFLISLQQSLKSK